MPGGWCPRRRAGSRGGLISAAIIIVYINVMPRCRCHSVGMVDAGGKEGAGGQRVVSAAPCRGLWVLGAGWTMDMASDDGKADASWWRPGQLMYDGG